MTISTTNEEFFLSFKLNFETTTNVSEYEALILGLEVANKVGMTQLFVFGD